MYFKEIQLSDAFSIIDLRYCTAYHLCNSNRKDEANILLGKDDEVERDLAAKEGVDVYQLKVTRMKKYFYDTYFNSGQEIYNYNTSIISFVLNSSEASVLTGYLDTEMGMDFIRKRLRVEFPNKAAVIRNETDKVREILAIYREATRRHYVTGFKNFGKPDFYLTSTFKYFMFNCRYRVGDILDRGSATVGEEEKDINRIKNESMQNVSVDYEIPNFKELVRNIYLGSVGLKYRYAKCNIVDRKTFKNCLTEKNKPQMGNNPFGIIVYDIYSCLKSNMVKHRVSLMVRDAKRSKILKNIKYVTFKEDDVNRYEYFTDNSDYDYRNYTSRKSLIDLLIQNLGIENNQELFRIIFNNPIEGDDDKNNTKVLTRDRQTFQEDIAIARDIIRGIKSAVFLIKYLIGHGIDPLSVKSAIFKDPAWLQRVNNLEDYMILYDNVVSLENDEFSIFSDGEPYITNNLGLRFNKSLTHLIQEDVKNSIAKITPDNVKKALSVDGFHRQGMSLSKQAPFLYCNVDNTDGQSSFDYYHRFYNILRDGYNQYSELMDSYKRFIYVMEYFFGSDEQPYIVRLSCDKNKEDLEQLVNIDYVLELCNFILDCYENGIPMIFPVDNEDITLTQDSDEIVNLDNFNFTNFPIDLSFLRVKCTEENRNDYQESLKECAENVINFYSFEHKKQVYDYTVEISEFLKDFNNELPDFSDEKLEEFGLSNAYLDQQFGDDNDIEKIKFVLNTVSDAYENLIKLPFRKDGVIVYNDGTTVDKLVLSAKHIDWMPKPDDFEEKCDILLEYAKASNNDELNELLEVVINQLKLGCMNGEDLHDVLAREVRDCSVMLFVGDKLSKIYRVFGEPSLNDIDFIDTLTICKDFINVLQRGCPYTELVQFDGMNFKRKLFRINRKCSYDEMLNNESLSQWEEKSNMKALVNPSREIFTCMPKKSFANKNQKMQNACDKAYAFYYEFIDFLSYCVKLKEADEVDITDLNQDDNNAVYDKLMRYADIIKLYPDKIAGYKCIDSIKNKLKHNTLFKDEYLMHNGSIITRYVDGHVYYLHKEGVYICPDFDVSDNRWVQSYLD